MLANLEKMRYDTLEAKVMRGIVNEKTKIAKDTYHLPEHQRVITLVCDYAQNLAMCHPGDEQPGEVFYYSPMNLFIFGLFYGSLDDKKLKAFVHTGACGQKAGRNVH